MADRVTVHVFVDYCLSSWSSVDLSVCLFIQMLICQTACPSVCLPVCLSVCLSVRPSVCLSIFLSIYLSISICSSVFLLPVCLSVRLSVHLFFCSSFCLSVRLTFQTTHQEGRRWRRIPPRHLCQYRRPSGPRWMTCRQLPPCSSDPSGAPVSRAPRSVPPWGLGYFKLTNDSSKVDCLSG